MKNREPVSVIILAYNEADTIEQELTNIYKKVIQKLPGSDFIVAEDGSTDGTTEIIGKLTSQLGIIHLTSYKRKGYKEALISAVRLAKNDYIFFCDSGQKHNLNDFWKLYFYRREYDLIVGKRTNRKDWLARKGLTFFYNLYLRKYFGFKNICDSDSGFRLFNRKFVNEIFEKKLTYTGLVNSEIVLRAIHSQLRYKEVPISYWQRLGHSRGLPLKRLPIEIFKVLRNSANLRKEFRNDK